MKLPLIKKGAKRLIASGMTVLLLMALTAQPSPADDSTAPPPPPVEVILNQNGHAGNWWRGAIPPHLDPTKPVLVFVHGLQGNASAWYGQTMYNGTNDMYATAYAAGYRTAFVDLGDADGRGQSMWTNAPLLSTALNSITAYYGVEKVNIIAHSKGGVDTNTAVDFYGADQHIAKVITLSSPHHGSQLADLAYSRWGGWLAELLGQRDDGVYVLQTAYMAWFRSVADQQPIDQNVSYYTADGTSWGPFGSALYFGGLYLRSWGRSDGAVTLTSAQKPGATLVATTGFNHDSIRVGHDTWPVIAPYVNSLSPTTASAAAPRSAVPVPDTASGGANEILRGGPLSGRTVTSFPVESGALSLDVSLLTSGSVAATLIDPAGNRQPLLAGLPGSNLGFAGAQTAAAHVPVPMPGLWRVEMLGPQQGAYLLAAEPTSDLVLQVNLPDGLKSSGQQVQVGVSMLGRAAGLQPQLAVQTGQVQLGKPTLWKVPVQALSTQPGGGETSFSLPTGASLVNVSGTVTGTLPDGTPFERDFVGSVGVAPQGGGSAAALQALAAPGGR